MIVIKILTVGDTHADVNFMTYVHQQAEKNEANVIFQVGDFGYFPGTKFGDRFLKLTSKDSENWGRDLYFLPGNHENWDILEQFESSYHETEWGDVWCAEVAPHIFYVPSSAQWEWDGKKFLSVGGAYSIDKEGRTPGISWWPQEMITDDEEALAIEAGKIDVLLTHDNSDYVDITDCIGKDVIIQTRVNRARISRIIDATHPAINIHGHYHYPYNDEIVRSFNNDSHLDWYKTKVIGLDCNTNPYGALYLLDTETL